MNTLYMIFTAHQPKYTKTVEQKLKVYRTISFDFSYNRYKTNTNIAVSMKQ